MSHYQQFDIPKTWVWTTLGEIFSMQAGKNIQASELQDYSKEKSFPCYGGNGVRGYLSKYSHHGTFPIIGRQGALCGNIKVASGYFFATEHAVVVDYYADTSVDLWTLFLEYLNLNQYATATAQPGLSVAKIEEIPIPLPPIREQYRIVESISKWLSLLNTISKDVNDLKCGIEDVKSKILELAMQGKLVPQDPTDEPAAEMLKRINPKAKIITDNPHYPQLPDNWVLVSMTDVCESKLGKTLNNETDEGIIQPYLCSINVKQGAFDLTVMKTTKIEPSEYERYSVYNGDLLICEGGDVGRCAIWKGDRIFYQNALHRVRPLEIVDLKFLYYLVLYARNKRWIEELCSGVTIKHFTTKAMSQLVIPIPPYNEQIRIVRAIENLYKYVESLQVSLN